MILIKTWTTRNNCGTLKCIDWRLKVSQKGVKIDPYHGQRSQHHGQHGHAQHGPGHAPPGHTGGHRQSMMDRGLYKMGGRLPVTTYYRTMSIDNKPTTVIIGPSKLDTQNLSHLKTVSGQIGQILPELKCQGMKSFLVIRRV